MALSMDEQRMLAEIERRLSADDPGLASCLTTFRRPGPATVLRSPRARIIGSLFTVLVVAMVSLMVYAMIPFRAHTVRNTAPSATPAGGVAVTATDTHQSRTQQAGISATGISATGISPSLRVSGRSTPSAAPGTTQPSSVKPAGASGSPLANP
ncbi:MAG: DUF3040 domain-containing protein [Streptosporangiaceae bacterium]